MVKMNYLVMMKINVRKDEMVEIYSHSFLAKQNRNQP